MPQTIEVSDSLYDRLVEESSRQGFASIEELLARTYASAKEVERRSEQIERIREVRERVHRAVGKMPDSTDLIRADRER